MKETEQIFHKPSVDKPLKHDRLDSTERKSDLCTIIATSLPLTFVASPLTLDILGNNLYLGKNLYLNLYLLIRSCQGIWHLKDSDERLEVFGEDLTGAKAYRLVYQGKDPLKIGENQFTKGDNFYYILFPSRQIPAERQSEAIEVISDSYNYTLQKMKEDFRSRNYKFVVVDAGNLDVFPESFPKTSRRDVTQGKEVEIKDKDKKVILLSREEFEDLTASPCEVFLQTTAAMHDKMLNHLLSLAHQAATPQEREKVKQLLNSRLNQILSNEVEAYFNSTPDVVFDRSERLYAPVRKRVYLQSSVRKTDNGFFFVQVNTANGEIRWIPLNNLLKTHLKPERDIINTTSPVRKAQLAYISANMLNEMPFENLIRNEPIDKRTVARRFKELNISPANLSGFAELELTKKGKFSNLIPSGVIAKARPILATLVAFSAVNVGTSFIQKPELLGELDNRPGIVEEDHKLEFSGMPISGLDWKIEGTIATDGYYVTGTSHEFSNGRWRLNKEIARKIDLPKSISIAANDQYQVLSKTQRVNSFRETAFRIPVKENTKIAAINIIGPDGKEISFETFELTDGVIEVKIPATLINNPAYVISYVAYFPNTTSAVHATEKIPVNREKLSGEVNTLIDKAQRLKDPASAIAQAVRDDHKYSIDPPDKDKLKDLTTPEQAANVIADIFAVSCEISNTGAVIAANAGDESVNMAFGYVNTNNTPAGAGGSFLRSETSHAFGIRENGEIVDATPSDIAGDQLTQDYINLLNNPSGDSNAWDNAQQTIRQESDQQKNLADSLKLLSLTLASAAGLFGIRQGSRLFKRYVTKENLDTLKEDISMKGFGNEDLRKAYVFFNWISWGKESSTISSDSQGSGSDKKELLSKIEDGINYDKLALYLENPKLFERIAARNNYPLSMIERLKLRVLARYLFL